MTLKVKPQISEGDAVKLEVDQSIQGIVAGSAGQNDLQTSERSVQTTVMVDDGKGLVLSGLISDDVLETESKVPFLGDIPILGALFRSKTTDEKKINLMIFLKPTILRDANKGLELTQSKYDFIRGKQLEIQDKGISFIADEDLPVLEAFDEYLDLPPPFEGEEGSVNAPPGGVNAPGNAAPVNEE